MPLTSDPNAVESPKPTDQPTSDAQEQPLTDDDGQFQASESDMIQPNE